MIKPLERRRYPRLRREERAVIRPLDVDAPEQNACHCITVDVSLNGLQVCLKQRHEPGELLDMLVNMEGYGDPFHLLGEVKWCATLRSQQDYCLGVEIKDTNDQNFSDWRRVFN
ncbi:MAG: PilZ domain-containing protein [Gammaproteobacteria bacterium]|nr:PilZ domain-containing protein [Gammaproteobacteria bacterium]